MKALWIVGRALDFGSSAWDFRGVFDDQHLAERCCIDDKHFVGPCFLNEQMPSDRVEWRGAYFPALERKIEITPSASVAIIELVGRTRPRRSKAE